MAVEKGGPLETAPADVQGVGRVGVDRGTHGEGSNLQI